MKTNFTGWAVTIIAFVFVTGSTSITYAATPLEQYQTTIQNLPSFRNNTSQENFTLLRNQVEALKPFNATNAPDGMGLYASARFQFVTIIGNYATLKVQEFRRGTTFNTVLLNEIAKVLGYAKLYRDGNPPNVYYPLFIEMANLLYDIVSREISIYSSLPDIDPDRVENIEYVIEFIKPYSEHFINGSPNNYFLYDLMRYKLSKAMYDKGFELIKLYNTTKDPKLGPSIRAVSQLLRPYNGLLGPSGRFGGMYDEFMIYVKQSLGLFIYGPEIKITNCLELQNIKSNLTGRYVLANDIDCTETTKWNNGSGFIPIGSGDKRPAFSGYFDGRNFTIKNLYINGDRPIVEAIGRAANTVSKIHSKGLFGVTFDADIRNVTLDYPVIIGGINEVGALVGLALDYSVFRLVHVRHGLIKASLEEIKRESSVGGLIGLNKGHVWRSSANGTIIGYGNVGGLIGENKGTIEEGYASGYVSALGNISSNVGGLVGINSKRDSGSSSNLWYSYAATTVRSTKGNIGGLVGNNSYGWVYRTYATGNVSLGTTVGANQIAGGLTALNNSATGNQSYWDRERTGLLKTPMVPDANGLTSSAMKLKASFPTFDFNDVWDICDNQSMPTLKSQYEKCFTRDTVIREGFVNQPAIFKDDIVWLENRNGSNNIYLFNTTTQQERRLAISSTIQAMPAINELYIAWLDFSNPAKSQVMLMNRLTGQVNSASVSNGQQTAFAMSDNYLTWIEIDPITKIPDIKLLDLKTQTVKNLTNGQNNLRKLYISVSNDLVVWLSEISATPAKRKIEVYDIKKGMIVDIKGLNVDYVSYAKPIVAGRNVIWVNQNIYYDLMMFNVDLPESMSFLQKDNQAQISPSANGDSIVWVDRPAIANGLSNIKMMNLITGKISDISLSIVSNKTMPSVYGNTVVWVDNRNAKQQLVYSKSGELPKVTLSINRTGDKEARSLFEITSMPQGIKCGEQCVSAFNQGETVTLTLTRLDGTKGYFENWNVLGCSNKSLTCTIKLDKNETINVSLFLQK